MWWYLIGWCAGWLMLARLHPLPAPPPELTVPTRSAVAVVVPARNEAASLPTLIRAILAQLREGDVLVVVDDHSTDSTAVTAAAMGARVVAAPDFDPDVWSGKPHACHVGAAATVAPTLVFLDADVHPSADLLDRLHAAVQSDPGSVISVQPWHETGSWAEQTGLLGNVVALMGTGACTPFGGRAAATLAFGPVLAVNRTTYDSVGGHGHPSIRRTRVEDIALARAVGRSTIYTGRPDIRFRMYPAGLRQTFDGWTRTLADGVGAAPWWATLAVVAWVWSLAGGWLVWPWAYVLSAAQVWVIGRRAGNFRVPTALLFPIPVALFVGAAVRSVVLRLVGRQVAWKGRRNGSG